MCVTVAMTLCRDAVAEETADVAAKVARVDTDVAMASLESVSGDTGGDIAAEAGLPGMDAYDSDAAGNASNSDSDSSDTSSESDVDVGTLRPLIKRLNDKIKKSC